MANDYPITKIVAEEISDSRGNPTLKVTIWTGDKSGSFSVPSGASTGANEAGTIPAQAAIEKVNKVIAPALVGKNIFEQKEIDELMLKLDGTENKSNLGGNAVIGVSVACAKAGAKVSGQETYKYLRTLSEIKTSRKTPYLYMNLINGGKHAKNSLAFQEYMIVPETLNAEEAVEMGTSIQNTLKEILIKKFGPDGVRFGDEGGFAPQTSDIEEPLYLLREAIKQNGLAGQVRLALDVAATSFYDNGAYEIAGKKVSRQELLDIYQSLVKEFNLLSIEDPFEETDFESFQKLAEFKNTLVVGDDLTVTNVKLLRQAAERSSINAMIVKPNQIGTLSETLEAMKLARENDIELIVSHRSGETEDDFIADLACAFGCFGLKAGAPSKPERMVKYKRLEKIYGK